nr:uncharacterized protein LOC127326759 [Lolium perenne]
MVEFAVDAMFAGIEEMGRAAAAGVHPQHYLKEGADVYPQLYWKEAAGVHAASPARPCCLHLSCRRRPRLAARRRLRMPLLPARTCMSPSASALASAGSVGEVKVLLCHIAEPDGPSWQEARSRCWLHGRGQGAAVPAWLILAARRPDASEMTRHTSMALRPASGDDDDAAALACAAPLQAKVRTAEPDEPSWHVATPTPKTSHAPAAGRSHWKRIISLPSAPHRAAASCARAAAVGVLEPPREHLTAPPQSPVAQARVDAPEATQPVRAEKRPDQPVVPDGGAGGQLEDCVLQAAACHFETNQEEREDDFDEGETLFPCDCGSHVWCAERL